MASRRGGRFVSGGGFDTCKHNDNHHANLHGHHQRDHLLQHQHDQHHGHLELLLALPLCLLGFPAGSLLRPVGQLRWTRT